VNLHLHSPNTPSWRGAQLKRSTETTLPLPNVISVIKSSRMRLAGHVTHKRKIRSAYKILVRRSKRKRPHGRPRLRR